MGINPSTDAIFADKTTQKQTNPTKAELEEGIKNQSQIDAEDFNTPLWLLSTKAKMVSEEIRNACGLDKLFTEKNNHELATQIQRITAPIKYTEYLPNMALSKGLNFHFIGADGFTYQLLKGIVRDNKVYDDSMLDLNIEATPKAIFDYINALPEIGTGLTEFERKMNNSKIQFQIIGGNGIPIHNEKVYNVPAIKHNNYYVLVKDTFLKAFEEGILEQRTTSRSSMYFPLLNVKKTAIKMDIALTYEVIGFNWVMGGNPYVTTLPNVIVPLADKNVVCGVTNRFVRANENSVAGVYIQDNEIRIKVGVSQTSIAGIDYIKGDTVDIGAMEKILQVKAYNIEFIPLYQMGD